MLLGWWCGAVRCVVGRDCWGHCWSYSLCSPLLTDHTFSKGEILSPPPRQPVGAGSWSAVCCTERPAVPGGSRADQGDVPGDRSQPETENNIENCNSRPEYFKRKNGKLLEIFCKVKSVSGCVVLYQLLFH